MANTKQTAAVVQQGDMVSISVYPAFYGLCAARKDIILWPDRSADSSETMPDTGVRQWSWRFGDATAARIFAQDAAARIAHWENILLGPNNQP